MSTREPVKPRLLRAVNPPLGSYFRVGRDHRPLQALLAENRASFSGLVLDAHDHQRHEGFAPAPRVYLPALGVFVSREQAASLFAKPGMRSSFACRDTSCCARGPADTDRDPRRHFLMQRQREVNDISRRPQPVRPGLYLEEFLRPATDLALRAAKVDRRFEPARKRLEDWRLTLGAMNQDGPPATVARSPEGKRTHPTLRRSA